MNNAVGLGFLILFLVVCVITGAYLVFTFQSASTRRTKRTKSNAKEHQTARDQVARFYGTNRTISPCTGTSIGKSVGPHLETVKLLDKTQGSKTEIVCGIQSPPLHTTVACEIQPSLESDFQKQRLTRAMSDGYHSIQHCSRVSGWSRINVLPKLSEPNIGRHVPFLLENIPSTSSCTHSPQDTVSLTYERKTSMEKFMDPMLRIFSAASPKTQYCGEGNWTNMSPNSNGSGQICFSLSYTCTFSLLNVTVSRLAGVAYLSKTSSTLPSRLANSFTVGLRVRQRTNRLKTEVNEMAYKTFFTQPISTSHNPTFDQSFSFKIASTDLDQIELVFTVLVSTLPDKCLDDTDRRRTRSTASLHHPYPQRPRIKKLVSQEMRCIGVTFFKLSRHELINCCDKLQNIWQELQELPDLEEVRHLGKEDDHNLARKEGNDFEDKVSETEKNITFQTEASSSNSDCGSRSLNEINISMVYRKSASSLEIQLNEVRGANIRKNDVQLFIRATLCSGDRRTSSSQSNYTKISKSDKAISSTHKSSGLEDSFANSFRPRGGSISFKIEMQDLISKQNLGIILHLYARNRIGLTRRLGHCQFGAQGFTHISESEHWSHIIKSVKEIQSNSHADETDLVSYWHVLMS